MVYLNELLVLDINVHDKQQFASTLRAVQRYLKAQGYKRGRRKGSSTTKPNIVYTDESYIHHHSKFHHQSLFVDAKRVVDIVLFTPPHHWDLQPIEMVWTIAKGEVNERLEGVFVNLKPQSIKGCVRVAEEKLQKLHEHLVQIDALESDDESSAERGNSSDEASDSE
ncbi:hypothetical protein H257_09091 [Aphanomyces astaci]|uniref:Tc1-like transposase DDE domain-containing protein n=1 Tax=Aphanomyces astaci TaxID=112090 RepID=W4GDR0_APHAT|nr:hypothetical protein H257_09091 [Aphanomyces astaci]ETV77204.1 hypothetical protein H257_09091 [Aphanomyces astaci]|eukprot:XP_009833510.1 hypothetical protein H257_09091 [Aphanomyces astaci]